MSILFVLRAYPDVDHTVPIMWKLLEAGERVEALISPGYDPRGDYRLDLLKDYENFSLHEVWPRRGGPFQSLRSALGWIRGLLPWSFWFVIRHGVRVVAVEWGHGIVDAYERRLSWRSVARLVKDFLVSVRDARREPLILRSNLLVAAWMLGRRLVCLPHGLNVKLDIATTEEAEVALSRGPYPWSDQNRFDAYVLNTEHHRQWHLDHAMGDPAVMQTWGSARWAPDWVEVNRRIAPPFEWPQAEASRIKVVLMVPKWKKKVDSPAVLELVRRLQAQDFVSLCVKGHPRPEDGSADPLRADRSLDWNRIHNVSGVNSVSLIRASDVVLDAGSSIGIEVVMQGKVLVNLAFIHEIRTLFDAIDDVAVQATSVDHVVEYLRQHVAGSPHQVPATAFADLLRRGVYGSRNEDFDILGLYSERIGGLIRGQLQSPAPTVPGSPVSPFKSKP